jgi:hypothetical protein
MNRWLLPFILASAFGQKSDVPYAPNSDGPGPTFSDKKVDDLYPGSYRSLRRIDFRDFTFLNFDKAGRPSRGYALRKGHFQEDDEFNHSSTDLSFVYYLLRPESTTGASALVLLSWFAAAGSSSSGGNAKVFTLTGNRLRVVQEINWDTRFEASQPKQSFDPNTNTLVIRSAHYIPGDAHCCVSAFDVVTFHWDGRRFVQTGIQTELSEYGKMEAKELPKGGPR